MGESAEGQNLRGIAGFMAVNAHFGSIVLKIPFAVVIALVIAVAGCGEGGATPDPAFIPAPSSIMTVAPPPPFSGNVPRFGRGTPPRDTLHAVRTFGDTQAFGYIAHIEARSDGLLVTDVAMSPHLVLIDPTTGEVLNRFGSNGFGPGEFRTPNWITAHPDDPALVWVFDPGTHRFALVNPSAPRQEATVAQYTLQVGMPIDRPVWVGNRLIAGGIFPDFSLVLMDEQGRTIERIVADPPYTAADISHTVGRALLNRNFMAPSPSGQRLAVAYQYSSRIDFFTAAGERYGTVQGPRATTPSYRIWNDRFFWEADNEMAYWTVTATDRYVYALFCGCRFEDEEIPTVMHVFDWSGDFVGEFELGARVTAIEVTDDDTVLYGAIHDPFPRFAEWRLPAWLSAGTGARMGVALVPE